MTLRTDDDIRAATVANRLPMVCLAPTFAMKPLWTNNSSAHQRALWPRCHGAMKLLEPSLTSGRPVNPLRCYRQAQLRAHLVSTPFARLNSRLCEESFWAKFDLP
jgi:hypothetical protein